MSWGNISERVRKDRIKVAIAAWAYETGHKPIMSDRDYDALADKVHQQRHIATGDHRLDRFFSRQFNPDTGMWVLRHPDPSALENIYARYYQKRRKRR